MSGRGYDWKKRAFLNEHSSCAYCGTPACPTRLTVDHVIPKSRGGRDHPSNWKAVCKGCNIDKGHLTLEEYDLIKSHRLTSGNPYPFNHDYLNKI